MSELLTAEPKSGSPTPTSEMVLRCNLGYVGRVTGCASQGSTCVPEPLPHMQRETQPFRDCWRTGISPPGEKRFGTVVIEPRSPERLACSTRRPVSSSVRSCTTLSCARPRSTRSSYLCPRRRSGRSTTGSRESRRQCPSRRTGLDHDRVGRIRFQAAEAERGSPPDDSGSPPR